MSFTARPYILHEANLVQLREFRPNVAVLPWGATESHNLHLPHGTDAIEATNVGEAAVAGAVAQGARCLLLPTIPFGNNNQQLSQVATITLRSSTQAAILHDVAMSLVRQGIDRLVILNFHGGNEFKPLIRDVMLQLPVFIVAINAYQVAPQARDLLACRDGGDHADESETSMLLHWCPEWVAMEQAGEGKMTEYALKSLKTPGVWAPRDWAALTADTGAGDPRAATAEKGRKIIQMTVDAIILVLVELSAAKNGDFPCVVRAKAHA